MRTSSSGGGASRKSGPSPPACSSTRSSRSSRSSSGRTDRERLCVDDDERLRRPGERDVELAESLRPLLGDRGRLDDNDAIELEPLRLSCGQHGNRGLVERRRDRKSTRLNSSHVKISYAVFCLKKKKKKKYTIYILKKKKKKKNKKKTKKKK